MASFQLKWFGIPRLIGIILGVGCVGVAGWWLVRVPPPPPETLLSFATTTIAESSSSAGISGERIDEVPQIITVHVAGAVKNPGVYRLATGSRVNDGIVAAGGATSVANLDVINLATVLNEGEQVYVPKRGEKPHVINSRPQLGGQIGGANLAGGPAAMQTMNINLASVIELEQLPGVGPATAKAIVAYREHHGAFLRVEDLLKVRGIGAAKLSEILPHVRVN